MDPLQITHRSITRPTRLGLQRIRKEEAESPVHGQAKGPATILLHEDRESVRDNYEQPGAGAPGCHLAPDHPIDPAEPVSGRRGSRTSFTPGHVNLLFNAHQ
jgi:hypothetical protein